MRMSCQMVQRNCFLRTSSLGWWLAASTIAIVAGCVQPTQPEGPTVASISDSELELLWDSAIAVLKKFDFQPARQDRAMGIIETLPSTSRQWGEFWRHDVSGSYGVAESSLHTIQRKATVRFTRGTPGWSMEVQVDVYRLSVPESQVTTASSAIQVFTGAIPTTEGQRVKDIKEQKRWVHLGRDDAIESHLLDRILSEAGQ